MVKYIRLFRLKSTLIYLFPFALALSVGLEQTGQGTARPVAYSWATIVFAYMAYFCGSFFSSTLNFYADVPADRVHDGLYKDQDISRQPFVTGEVSRLETVLVFMITGVGCVVFSLLVNWRFAVFMLSAVLLLGILYSHPWFRFKEKPVLDIVTNATGAVLILYAGMAIVSLDNPPIQPIVFGWLFSAAMYMPSVANDVPFDKAAGYRTSGVVFGPERLLYATVPLTAGIVAVGIWGVFFSPSLNWQYKLFLGLGTPAAVLATTLVLLLYFPPHIQLNPHVFLVPLACLLLFYVVMGFYTLATAA
ncbi:MAG: UbiA prenyltransferase family protein [Actinobacteria bacterium]|nr:UbiA prenyltransferase family protein [Actinomycetota bacterium]MBU1943952.1 UbiA prenyltransferase family protein [Actinomycetota bacterium]MBU2686960.1 UbiA prenyltransferase family protein [Actinomycetota bacterium]